MLLSARRRLALFSKSKNERKTLAKIQLRRKLPCVSVRLGWNADGQRLPAWLAWREALEKAGIELSVWRIHRRIGMSGGLFVNALLRETGHKLSKQEAAQLQRLHAEAYARLAAQVRPLPGARELLDYLSKRKVPWAVATSGRMESAGPALKILGVDPGKVVVITRDQVQYAKPDPDLFLAAADRLGVEISASVVVGDSVWDLLAAGRARALGVGLLSGGYGTEELEKARR